MHQSDMADTWTFIKLNNDLIMKSGPAWTNGKAWTPLDTITICDGGNCVTLVFYVGCACWMPPGPTFKDKGHGYKNSNVSRDSGSSGDEYADYTVVITSVVYTPYYTEKTGTVTVVPVSATSDGFGAGFSMNYDWDTYSTTSSTSWYGDYVLSGGGGGCGNNCVVPINPF